MLVTGGMAMDVVATSLAVVVEVVVDITSPEVVVEEAVVVGEATAELGDLVETLEEVASTARVREGTTVATTGEVMLREGLVEE